MSRDGIRRSPVPQLVSDAELAEFAHGLALRARRMNADGTAVVEIALTLPDGRKTTRAAGTTREAILRGLRLAEEELSLPTRPTSASSASIGPKSPLGEVACAWRRDVETHGYRSTRNQVRHYKASTLRTFDDYYAAHLAGRRDSSGVLSKAPHPILNRPIGKIRADVLREIFEHDWADLSDASKGKLHQLLTRIFDYAVEQGCLPRNPMKQVDGYDTRGRLHDDKYLSIEQMSALMASVSDEDGVWEQGGVLHASYYRPHIKMLLFTGLRIGELVSLRWEDVVFGEESCASYATIRQHQSGPGEFTPKSRAGARMVHLTDDLAIDLKRHRETQMRHSERARLRRGPDTEEPAEASPASLVFTSPWGRRLNERQFRKVLCKVAAAAGIRDHIHPHYLRHTSLTYWADAVNGNSKVFHYIAGHANRTVTDRYVAVPRSSLIEATKRFQRHVARKVD